MCRIECHRKTGDKKVGEGEADEEVVVDAAEARVEHHREDDQEVGQGGPVGEEAAEEVEDGEDDLFHIDEVLGIANELDQTVMGGGIGARDEEEEEEALALQRHLHQQRLNSERASPRDQGEC